MAPHRIEPVPKTALQSLVLRVYAAVMRGLQPLLRRKLRRRGQREPGYLVHMAQRFGRYEQAAPEPGRLWVHAVSLGETRAAALLITALRTQWPGLRLLLTHSTATGWAQGTALLEVGDAQAWLPWDTPEATRGFLRHHRPVAGVLMETEVWPQLVQSCAEQQVPLFLLNARMNEASHRSAARLACLSRPAFQGLQAVFAQSSADAQRLSKLGARVTSILGNLKFDVPAQPQAQALAQQLGQPWQGRPIVMLASSREGEELLWLQALERQPMLAQAFRDLRVLWLVVPRHPQRFDEVHELLVARAWPVVRRTDLGSDQVSQDARWAEVCLGDSVGEMPVYYHLADMALLGGSFMPLGGQNLIEAAAFGCPVVMGPHTFNFAEAAQMAQGTGAGCAVADMEAALLQVQRWLTDPQALSSAAQAGLAMVQQGQGAAMRYAQALCEALPSR